MSPSILPHLASLSFLSLPSSHFQRRVGVKRSVGFVFFFYFISSSSCLWKFCFYTRRTKAQREAWAAVSQRQWEEGVITTLQALIRSHVGPRSVSSAHSSQLAAAEGAFCFFFSFIELFYPTYFVLNRCRRLFSRLPAPTHGSHGGDKGTPTLSAVPQ